LIMRRLFFLPLVFILCLSHAEAQIVADRLTFNLYSGYCTFGMDLLKRINEFSADEIPFQVNTIDNFDPGFYFGFSVQTRVSQNFYLGIHYQYYSTGSRIGQKDYSGYYAFDQIITGRFLGAEPGAVILKKPFVELSSSLQVGIVFSEMVMNETLTVQELDESTSQDLSATSLVLLPSIKAAVPFLTFASFFISPGGMIDLGGKLHRPGDRDAVLYFANKQTRTGWGGLRISAGISIRLIR
jgi:hypothetical protein